MNRKIIDINLLNINKDKTFTLFKEVIMTPVGNLEIVKNEVGILKADFLASADVTKVTECILFTNKTDLLLSCTMFQQKVYSAIMNIKCGHTATYQEIANLIGHPRAWRAVANALARNCIAYFIPCHRVIKSDGSPGGYKWGTAIKEKLLAYERAIGTADSQ